MRLPSPSASPRQYVRFGRYVARRLRREKLIQLADDVTSATSLVRDAGRAWEDADDGIQDALADRDGADDHLDSAAQLARANLAGRSVDAVKKAPYTAIFHAGIGYYTAAPLAEEVKRYDELSKRLVEHLPEGDDVRARTTKAIAVGLADFVEASTTLEGARTAEGLAGTKLAAATDAWTTLLEKTYGALVAERVRAEAERFFPKTRGKAAAAEDDAAPAPKPA